jgi:antitoxin component of MazEF toxin-antitoxin module
MKHNKNTNMAIIRILEVSKFGNSHYTLVPQKVMTKLEKEKGDALKITFEEVEDE